MDEYEHFEQVKNEYIESVLKCLFSQANRYNIAPYSASKSLQAFSIKLSGSALINCAPHYAPASKSFIHFTSLQALHSILNEQCIRMYNLNNANDPNEIAHVLTDINLEASEIDKFKNQTYFLSMCASDVLNSDNVLNLWRLYGNGGWGVAIELEIDNVNSMNNDFILAKLLYEKLDLKKFAIANQEFEEKNNLRVELNEVLTVPACLHKSPYFKVEEEVRLVQVIDYPIDVITAFGSDYGFDFNNGNERVSYYKLKIHKDEKEYHRPKISIKKVQVGFRHTPSEYEKIKDHLSDLSLSIGIARKKLIQFEIEQSPLANIYRS